MKRLPFLLGVAAIALEIAAAVADGSYFRDDQASDPWSESSSIDNPSFWE